MTDITAHDRIWAAIIRLDQTAITVQDIQDQLAADDVKNRELAYGSSGATDSESSVSDEDIQAALQAGVELGVIQHDGDQYEKKVAVDAFAEY